ncbi:hypothetical protein ACFE04_020523 [Oxalis oulophora]
MDRDRISKLPDELIEDILSRLTMKQAITTNLISHRFKGLWKFYSDVLDFEVSTTFNNVRTQLKQPNPSKAATVSSITSDYVNWVNHVFLSHQGTTIKDLTSFSSLDKPSTLYYVFPIRSHSSFQSLKRLLLIHVDIDGVALGSLVANCPNINVLYVTFSKSLTALELSSLSLKYLTLWLCGGDLPVNIKIYAPNLLSFTGTKSKLVLEDVSRLKYVCHYGCLSQIQSLHSQLDELKLTDHQYCCSVIVNEMNINLTESSHLKNLTLAFCLLDDNTARLVLAYLNAAPLLENFTIEDHCYKNLRTVKFVKFGDANNHVELIRRLHNHAPLLEKIIIHPYKGNKFGFGEKQTSKKARERAKKLRDILPSDVTPLFRFGHCSLNRVKRSLISTLLLSVAPPLDWLGCSPA